MSAAFIRRSVAVSFLLALLMGVFAMPALAGGRQVLADYEDNGQIEGCYTLADYEEALKLIRPDQQQYGAAVDVIRQAELTNIRRPGQACGATSASGSSSDVPSTDASASNGDASGGANAATIEQDEGGLSAVVIAIIVAVGLALIGFVIYLVASRRGGSGGSGGDGGSGAGEGGGAGSA